MNILHVSYSLSESSAATRLAHIQQYSGDNVHFLLARKSSYDFVYKRQIFPNVYFVLSLFSRLFDTILKKISMLSKDEFFVFGTFDFYNSFFIKHIIDKHNIDVIHFHWCGVGYFSLQSIISLKDYKIIITFHDYHLATGGCHIPMGCKNIDLCSDCHLVEKNKYFSFFFKTRVKNRKALFLRLANNKNIHFISPSQYTFNFLSSQLESDKHFLIGNAIGNKYYKVDLDKIKNNFIDSTKPTPNLLFVGVKKSSRDNKGFLLMSRLVEFAIKNKWNVNFNFVACDIPESIQTKKFNNYNFLKEDKLINLYCSVDLCVLPSKYETFSQICLESILCCTPIIAFDLTGPKDILENDFPFFLVPSFNEELFIDKVSQYLFFKRENFSFILEKRKNIYNKYSPNSIYLSHKKVYYNYEKMDGLGINE